jgi:hypothetical protein
MELSRFFHSFSSLDGEGMGGGRRKLTGQIFSLYVKIKALRFKTKEMIRMESWGWIRSVLRESSTGWQAAKRIKERRL